jgi:hypothetical protein
VQFRRFEAVDPCIQNVLAIPVEATVIQQLAAFAKLMNFYCCRSKF